MHTSHLRKHIIADNGLIGSDGDTAIALHQTGDIIQLILLDVRLGLELVLEDHLHTRQWCITTTLTQSVHCHVQSFGTTQYGSQRVRHSQVIIIMGMEIEVGIRIAFHHFPEILDTLQRIHDT